MMINSLYIHIPFCQTKCNYCDFNSYPLPISKGWVEAYLASLKKEIMIYSQSLPMDQIRTVYMGGGTPTILNELQLKNFIAYLHEVIDFSKVTEATIEANPGTLNYTKLKELKAAGFNRISIGVQSFNKDELIAMGRTHTVMEAKTAIKLAKDAGFNNINLDLIYGLPNQLMTSWRNTINQAIKLDVDHISAYGLIVENNTPWGRKYLQGNLQLPDDEKTFEMYQYINKSLKEKGFIHYEISNYCKPGMESRHNKVYWQNNFYLGIGSGASSHYEAKRFYNLDNPKEYIKYLSKGKEPIEEIIHLSKSDQISETIFMNLRLIEGLNISDFNKRFGISPIDQFPNEIKELTNMGLLFVGEEFIKLTEKGIPLANLVFEKFV